MIPSVLGPGGRSLAVIGPVEPNLQRRSRAAEGRPRGINRPRCRSGARVRSLGGQAGCAPPPRLPHQAHGQRL